MVLSCPFVSVVLGYSEQNIGEGAELSVLSRLEELHISRSPGQGTLSLLNK
ncbi:hypothetical protein [Nostoc sp.]|jgi:hypothetical protein|uniref:hypothetical protein n=1 Tax=Nostoc sp. TaxID=1180 RepID=UPI002FF82A14